MRARYAVPATLGLTAAGTAAYAGLVERSWFALRRVTVPVLAPGAQPIRVVHVSDVHMRAEQRRKQEFLRDLAGLCPDLVVTTGDNLAGVDATPAMLDAMAPLGGFAGVFVLGSNDYYAPRPKNPLRYVVPGGKRPFGRENEWRDLVAGYTGFGWLDLTNRRTSVTLDDGRRVEVAGVDDPHLRRDRLEVADPPIDPHAALHLGLVHTPEPRALDRFATAGFDLLLCGHTHGGQLRLPGVGALVTNCGIDRARARGLSRYDGAWLHVSAGLGTSPYAPVRFACRPEATLLTLVPRDASAGAR